MKCLSCGGALAFDPQSGKVHCAHCGQYFDVETLHPGNDGSLEADGDTMAQKVYTCTSCGARVMVNDVESATYCIYCDQPTIVFDRITDLKRPKAIVPFSVTKEQAHEIIRRKLKKGRYVPKSIRNFSMDMIRGIYIPFRKYDVHYREKTIVKSSRPLLFLGFWGMLVPSMRYSEGSVDFRNVTVDASGAFNDESAHKLEPYELDKRKPFHMGYLMGFYGDCYDEDIPSMNTKVMKRCNELYEEELLDKSLSKLGKSYRNSQVVDYNFQADILDSEYILLPVWFVVFHEKGQHYTMMVNGQTGKAVGTVPTDRGKMKRDSRLFSLLYLSVPLLPLLLLLLHAFRTPDGFLWLLSYLQIFASYFVYIIIFLVFLIPKYLKTRREFENSLGLTQENAIRHLAADRQGSKN